MSDDQTILHQAEGHVGDHRDLVIEHLVADEAELHVRVRDLEGERDGYRRVLQVALAELRRLTLLVDRQGERQRELLNEYRRLRDDHRRLLAERRDERRAA